MSRYNPDVLQTVRLWFDGHLLMEEKGFEIYGKCSQIPPDSTKKSENTVALSETKVETIAAECILFCRDIWSIILKKLDVLDYLSLTSKLFSFA